MKGGYQILDFKDYKFTNLVTVNKEGIYNEIETFNNHLKPILVNNLYIGTGNVYNFFTSAQYSKNAFWLGYKGVTFDLVIKIDRDDNITIKMIMNELPNMEEE